eukprot:scaffold216995_cov28-Tisochrysis_lutea.AAC.5
MLQAASVHVAPCLALTARHVSCQVLSEMSPRPPVQLVSYHSTSKGFLGECGLRGGYYELVGFDPDVQVCGPVCGRSSTRAPHYRGTGRAPTSPRPPCLQAQLLKLASISLCSNTTGQIMTGLMVQPPKPGDASYDSYVSERDGILNSLKRRSAKLVRPCPSRRIRTYGDGRVEWRAPPLPP